MNRWYGLALFVALWITAMVWVIQAADKQPENFGQLMYMVEFASVLGVGLAIIVTWVICGLVF